MGKFKKFYISSKPGIVYFVGIVALSSAYIGSPHPFKDMIKILMVSLGVMLSAAGSALINNILDREIDRLMERTSKRPTAKGEIDVGEGIGVAVFMIFSGIVFVIVFGGIIPAIFDILAVISYDVLYTLILKRKDPFGVVLGGIPGALPTLIGYYSTAGRLDILSLILFAFMFLWQPPHFWALAIKYKGDYARGNLPVMPLIYGDKFTKLQSLLYSASILPLVILPVILGYVKPIFLIFVIPSTLAFVYLHIISLKRDVPLGKIFAFSNLLLVMFFVGFILSKDV